MLHDIRLENLYGREIFTLRARCRVRLPPLSCTRSMGIEGRVTKLPDMGEAPRDMGVVENILVGDWRRAGIWYTLDVQ